MRNEQQKDGFPIVQAKDKMAWRNWLQEYHATISSVWLKIYKKNAEEASITYQEAVEEALCFGWIDSKPNKNDEKSYFQFFSKRNPKSNWSKKNKISIEKLLAAGRMMPAGLEMIKQAKESGTWDALNDVEDLMVPEDLDLAFKANAGSFEHWEKFPKSVKRGILEWILNAKKPETRAKRILETASLAAKNIRANQFR